MTNLLQYQKQKNEIKEMRQGVQTLFNTEHENVKRKSDTSQDTNSEVMVEIVSGKIEFKMDNVVIKDLLKWVIDEKQESTDKSFKAIKEKENSQKKMLQQK